MELTREQAVSELKALLEQTGWTVFENEIRAKMINAHNALASLKRPEGMSDDFLRGQIDLSKFVLAGLRKELSAFDAEKAANAAAAAQTDPPAQGGPYAKEDNPPPQ